MRSKGAQRKNALTDNTKFQRAKYTVKQVVITNFATLRIKIPSGSPLTRISHKEVLVFLLYKTQLKKLKKLRNAHTERKPDESPKS